MECRDIAYNEEVRSAGKQLNENARKLVSRVRCRLSIKRNHLAREDVRLTSNVNVAKDNATSPHEKKGQLDLAKIQRSKEKSTEQNK